MSVEARREIGMLLWELQDGGPLAMPHSRTVPRVGPRGHELRVNDRNKTWLPVYGPDRDAIVIPDVFEKKTTDARAGHRESPAPVAALRGEPVMKKLKNGWVGEFLHLSDADVEYIETRRALSRLLKEQREKLHLTQVQVAKQLATSRSRVARMEKADPSASADLLLQSLFRLGIKRKESARAIGEGRAARVRGSAPSRLQDKERTTCVAKPVRATGG